MSFLLSVTLAKPSRALGIHSFAKWTNRWTVHPTSGHSLIHFLTCKSKCFLYLHHRISLRAKYSDEHLFKEYKRWYKAVKRWLNVLCASRGKVISEASCSPDTNMCQRLTNAAFSEGRWTETSFPVRSCQGNGPLLRRSS